MGQFSWRYSNADDRSIKSGGGKAIMVDDLGNIWVEHDYAGYGVFGGKDFYELLAEMNGYDADRDIGITLAFGDTPPANIPRLFSFETTYGISKQETETWKTLYTHIIQHQILAPIRDGWMTLAI